MIVQEAILKDIDLVIITSGIFIVIDLVLIFIRVVAPQSVIVDNSVVVTNISHGEILPICLKRSEGAITSPAPQIGRLRVLVEVRRHRASTRHKEFDAMSSRTWFRRRNSGERHTANVPKCGRGHRYRGSRCIESEAAIDSQSTPTCHRAPHVRRWDSDRQPEAK